MGYFYNRFGNDSLNKAYELLENCTPLKFDCGALCGGKCCKGGDNDGMILFPGEEKYYAGKSGFTVKKDLATGCLSVVCSGECSRTERPLSCRIFPFFFYAAEKDGKIRIRPGEDIRARGVCPLVGSEDGYNREFERKMRIAASFLEQDAEMCRFLNGITKKITDFGAFSLPRTR